MRSPRLGDGSPFSSFWPLLSSRVAWRRTPPVPEQARQLPPSDVFIREKRRRWFRSDAAHAYSRKGAHVKTRWILALVMGWLLALLASASPLHAGSTPAEPIWPRGEELGRNGDFSQVKNGTPEGWTLSVRDTDSIPARWGDYGMGGAKGILLVAQKDRWCGIGQTLTHFAPGVPVVVTAWIRMDHFKGNCFVWARCAGKDDVSVVGPHSQQTSLMAGYDLSGTSAWSPVTVTVTPNQQAARVMFGVRAIGAGTIRVSQLRARASIQDLGPGLYQAEGRYRGVVRRDHEGQEILVPMPLLWYLQIPVSFRLWSEPEGWVRSVTLKPLAQGGMVADVQLRGGTQGQFFGLFWSGDVLISPSASSPIPPDITLPLKEIPAEARPWTRATWCCDFDNPELAKAARAIREKAGNSAAAVIAQTLDFMERTNRSAKAPLTCQRASNALTQAGFCTANANLGAALLRAQGIPARIVACYPTWAVPLQTHYIVEYWLPGTGWRLMETTYNQDDLAPSKQVGMALVTPEDEGQEEAGRRASAGCGVPYLSLTEYPGIHGHQTPPIELDQDLFPGHPYCDHEAAVLALYGSVDPHWERAEAVLAKRWSERTGAVIRGKAGLDSLAAPPGLDRAVSLSDVLEALGVAPVTPGGAAK